MSTLEEIKAQARVNAVLGKTASQDDAKDTLKLIAALEAVGRLTESWHDAYQYSASEFNDIRDDAAYEIEQAITEALA